MRNDDAFGIKKPSWPRFFLLWTYYIDATLLLEFLFSKEVFEGLFSTAISSKIYVTVFSVKLVIFFLLVFRFVLA